MKSRQWLLSPEDLAKARTCAGRAGSKWDKQSCYMDSALMFVFGPDPNPIRDALFTESSAIPLQDVFWSALDQQLIGIYLNDFYLPMIRGEEKKSCIDFRKFFKTNAQSFTIPEQKSAAAVISKENMSDPYWLFYSFILEYFNRDKHFLTLNPKSRAYQTELGQGTQTLADWIKKEAEKRQKNKIKFDTVPEFLIVHVEYGEKEIAGRYYVNLGSLEAQSYDVDGGRLRMASLILWNGVHYICIYRCGGAWWLYDDMELPIKRIANEDQYEKLNKWLRASGYTTTAFYLVAEPPAAPAQQPLSRNLATANGFALSLLQALRADNLAKIAYFETTPVPDYQLTIQNVSQFYRAERPSVLEAGIFLVSFVTLPWFPQPMGIVFLGKTPYLINFSELENKKQDAAVYPLFATAGASWRPLSEASKNAPLLAGYPASSPELFSFSLFASAFQLRDATTASSLLKFYKDLPAGIWPSVPRGGQPLALLSALRQGSHDAFIYYLTAEFDAALQAPAPTAKPAPAGKAPLDQLRALHKIYTPKFQFPFWVLDKYAEYAPSMTKARIYTHSADKQLVLKLATEREPVNIAQSRRYDAAALQAQFGWAQAYYQTHWEKFKTLAPNFSIYTPALVDLDTAPNPCAAGYKPRLHNVPVHIIHAVGLAFDTATQPDYEYYFSLDRETRITEISAFYERMFQQIFACAAENGLTEVVMSLVGANNFASAYNDGKRFGPDLFQETIWAPVFIKFWAKLSSQMSNKQVPYAKLSFMGAAGSTALKLIKAKFATVEDTGLFPANVVKRPNALFVNAWDPLSMPGNGNCSDNSLDGFIGRRSNVAAVGWPLSNPSLTEASISVLS